MQRENTDGKERKPLKGMYRKEKLLKNV